LVAVLRLVEKNLETETGIEIGRVLPVVFGCANCGGEEKVGSECGAEKWSWSRVKKKTKRKRKEKHD
jgi:hypothetical protein